MNAGYAGSAESNRQKEATFNERLNRLSGILQTQCERIEGVLCRINGTPQAQGRPVAEKIAQITPMLPLSTVVEHLEAVQNRLADLANGIERIA